MARGFLNGALAGRPKASMYWPALHRELLRTNPVVDQALQRFRPERLNGAL